MSEESKNCVAIYFDEAEEVRAAHFLYEDLKEFRPDISKMQFYVILIDARGGHDGYHEHSGRKDLGWKLRIKPSEMIPKDKKHL